MIVLDCTDRAEREAAVARAAMAVRRGDVVVVPTESSYAVAADAFNPAGTHALRELKGIGSQVPLAAMVPSAFTVSGLASVVTPAATDLMRAFWPGLLTVLLPAQATLAWDHPPGSPVAVRMPLHPLLLALLTEVGPMAVTSANAPGMDAPRTVEEAQAQLGDAAALALDAGPLQEGESSTVIDLRGTSPLVVREGAISLEQLQSVRPDVRLAPTA